jgi:glycosyltransferase involved in cell wall biosynthesis
MLKVSIIANGFQKDYIVNLIAGLSKSTCAIEFTGSSFYDLKKIEGYGKITEIKDERNYNSSLFGKVGNNLKYYKRLITHFIKQKSDIVHVQWLNLIIPDGIIFPLFLKLLGMKTVYTVHDVLPHSRDHLINRLLFWLVYRCHNHLLVHTNYIKLRLVKEFGIPPDKIDIIKHGVYEVPDNPAIDKHKARNLLSLSKDDMVVLLFGIITRYKGLDILLEAFARFSKSGRRAILIVAGKVAKDYRTEFDRLIKTFKTENIHVFSHYISAEKMDVLFKAADVTVLPYIEASQSGVLFMSYAYGKPVIAPKLGGFLDDIVVGKTGYLFETGQPKSLEKTLRRFQKEWIDGLPMTGDPIIEFAHEHYSWDKTGEALFSIYSELTSHKTKRNSE